MDDDPGKGWQWVSLRDEAEEAAPPAFSDDALAAAFSAEHGGRLLHVAVWGQWLLWDGTRWARDETLAVPDLARGVCRAQSVIAGERAKDGPATPWVKRLAGAQTVGAVVALARADRRHARPSDAFDAEPWALNTPAGVVDLRTGTMRPRRADDLPTKVAGTAPGDGCPRWLEFLAEITGGDPEVISYLRRWAGYCLTGETREHAFLFLVGPGGNGKSVLVNTLAAAMGDYAATAPMETFMAAQHDRHPTDLAMLRGARLVLANETDAGRALAESRLKALTGGDRITARFMRQDFFTYQPAFKLVMVGNHRPVIRNPDDALRRRLHLLPIAFRPEAPDQNLGARLRGELPGILGWAVEGCLEWQRDGLGMPEAVRLATAEFFAEQDLLAQWLTERCEQKATFTAASASLYRNWTHWAQERGEIPGTQKAFSAELERHHAKRKVHGVVTFLGLRLRLDAEGPV